MSPVNITPEVVAKLPVAVTPPCQELPLYTLNSLADVLKNKSPTSKLVVGLVEPIRYLLAKVFTSVTLVATVLMFVALLTTLLILLALLTAALILDALETALFILLELLATAVMLELLLATVVTSDEIPATVVTVSYTHLRAHETN